jgi:O-succinylbenzoic acid--CoA ligase
VSTIPLHPEFKLNGTPYTIDELNEHAYTLVKEGEQYEVKIGAFLLDWLSDEPTLTVLTSGSTGIPTSYVIKKLHMVSSAMATGSYFRLQAGSSALHCLPTDFIAGKMMLVRAMVLGLRITCVAPTAAPILTDQNRYDFAAMVPLQLRNTIDYIDCVDCLIVGGAPLSADLKELIAKKSTKIYETYGMTETVTHIAIKPVNHLSGQDLAVLEAFNTVPDVSVSQDDRGCLVIDAPKLTDGLVVTNDMVNLISPTQFRWLGRYDNIINSGGIKLIPEQIEAMLSNIISQRFFVAGLADEVLGQKLVLVVEGKVQVEEIKGLLKTAEGFSKYQIPKNIFVLPKFVATKTGKIQRSKTLELLNQ